MSALLDGDKLHPKVRETHSYVITDDRFRLRHDIATPWGMQTVSEDNLELHEMPAARLRLVAALEKYMLRRALGVEQLLPVPAVPGYLIPDWERLKS